MTDVSSKDSQNSTDPFNIPILNTDLQVKADLIAYKYNVNRDDAKVELMQKYPMYQFDQRTERLQLEKKMYIFFLIAIMFAFGAFYSLNFDGQWNIVVEFVICLLALILLQSLPIVRESFFLAMLVIILPYTLSLILNLWIYYDPQSITENNDNETEENPDQTINVDSSDGMWDNTESQPDDVDEDGDDNNNSNSSNNNNNNNNNNDVNDIDDDNINDDDNNNNNNNNDIDDGDVKKQDDINENDEVMKVNDDNVDTNNDTSQKKLRTNHYRRIGVGSMGCIFLSFSVYILIHHGVQSYMVNKRVHNKTTYIDLDYDEYAKKDETYDETTYILYKDEINDDYTIDKVNLSPKDQKNLTQIIQNHTQPQPHQNKLHNYKRKSLIKFVEWKTMMYLIGVVYLAALLVDVQINLAFTFAVLYIYVLLSYNEIRLKQRREQSEQIDQLGFTMKQFDFKDKPTIEAIILNYNNLNASDKWMIYNE